jgi:hypothetical protein
LGLAVSLNPNTSGGAERAASVTEAQKVVNEATFIGGLDPAVMVSGGGDRDLPIGLGRIVRDEAGQIIAVETDDDVDRSPPNHQLDLVEEVAATRSPESQSWISLGRTSGVEKSNTELIQGVLLASGDNRFDLTFHGIIFAAVSMNCFMKRSLTSFLRVFRDSLPKGK